MKNIDGPIRSINITTLDIMQKINHGSMIIKQVETELIFLSNLRTINVATIQKESLTIFHIYQKHTPVSGLTKIKLVLRVFLNTGTGKQINLTVNPDFGQAESDEVIVNFSAQEILYSEKEGFLSMKTNLCLIYLTMTDIELLIPEGLVRLALMIVKRQLMKIVAAMQRKIIQI